MTSSKSTKRALVSSTLAILMCVAMLIGTTFAWFTDTASTGVNKIQAGNLDIEVKYRTSLEEEWKTIDNATDLFGAEGTLFEPGHTRVVELRITNAGNLALKYRIGMNVVSETAGTNKAGNPYKLSDYLADPQKFIEGFEESVKTFTGLGLDVHVTELDIRVYENDGDPPAFDSLPLSVELQQAEMYADIFEVLREYSLPWKDGAGCVTNVTVWGAADDSAAWDTEAHKEYPLLFDEEHRPKEAYYSIISF